jgi:hypothetical protein
LTVASEATASLAAPLELTATVTDDGLPVSGNILLENRKGSDDNRS